MERRSCLGCVFLQEQGPEASTRFMCGREGSVLESRRVLPRALCANIPIRSDRCKAMDSFVERIRYLPSKEGEK